MHEELHRPVVSRDLIEDEVKHLVLLPQLDVIAYLLGNEFLHLQRVLHQQLALPVPINIESQVDPIAVPARHSLHLSIGQIAFVSNQQFY